MGVYSLELREVSFGLRVDVKRTLNRRLSVDRGKFESLGVKMSVLEELQLLLGGVIRVPGVCEWSIILVFDA